MSSARRSAAIVIALVMLPGAGATIATPPAHGLQESGPDGGEEAADAAVVVAAVKKAIGDHDALRAEEPFRFRFTVSAGGAVATERRTTWSPARGLARVELATKAGRVVAAFETGGSRFAVENDGARLEGADAEKVLAQVKKAFRGDWNYLTLAHRLADPALTVTREPDAVEDGKTYARLAIAYDSSNPAFAGDRYGLLVDLETGLPRALFVKWKSMKLDQAPLRFDYTEWTTAGSVKLPRVLTGVGNPQVLTFDGLETKVVTSPTEFLGLEP